MDEHERRGPGRPRRTAPGTTETHAKTLGSRVPGSELAEPSGTVSAPPKPKQEESEDFQEVWVNGTSTNHYYQTLDSRGDMHPRTALPGAKIRLKTKERVRFSEDFRDNMGNPFYNGAFLPEKVPSSYEADNESNTLTDDEVVKYFNGDAASWEKLLKQIDSQIAFNRYLALAESKDLPLSRYEQLRVASQELKVATRGDLQLQGNKLRLSSRETKESKGV